MLSLQDRPIIESRLDTDFYKFSMGQMIYHKHPDVPVTFALKNRTKSVRLADLIDLGELREQLDHAQRLQVTNSELHYVGGTFEYGDRMFKEDYIKYLRGSKLSDYALDACGGQISLEFSGNWPEASMWETFALSIVNELYVNALMKGYSRFERDLVFAEGQKRLVEKMKLLREHPELTFSDFGTRRRAFKQWQDYLTSVLVEEMSSQQFRGTSNIYLAMKYGLVPMGTNAHELPMVYSGIHFDEDESSPLASQKKVLEDWEREYGLGLSIFLPDTFGSDYFFRNIVTPKQLAEWKGSRHDSGDPFIYGDKRIEEYNAQGIDPSGKMLVFADGLDVPLMIRLGDYFRGRVQRTFGIGTNLTNDIGFKPISIVVKATESNGHPVAKLSDNIEKATGEPVVVERMKRLVGYDVRYAEECRY